ncbi:MULTISPECIES: cytochrome c [unclassified Beijerinckia]|uniref:c-type cytochrome n=1 Tax=unclassified Beijerinckia TaxID=2638183 RepID=UPI00089C37AA|nr:MULTISPECIES: cytochrome c [unclassified Beijerinckia]MDH7799325.1 mono/diheme cytochrome c family protein [Beijerinckia sp. GAS462]SED46302.1 Cytochrome c, mono-and diheme variants [Beijerinckia sp. 28-YEA-48]
MIRFSFSPVRALVLGVLALPLALSTTQAQDLKPTIGPPGFAFAPKDGPNLYVTVCQGCHMPGGKGAVGAGIYPALANNKNLEAGAYPVEVVVNGLRGMPPFRAMLNDEQVAAVVNYVRTSFGNKYTDAVTAEDVKLARPTN